MTVKLFRLDGVLFDTVEAGPHPRDLIVFNERVWKRAKAGEFHEVKSTFVPLPSADTWSAPHAFRGVSPATPSKKFSPARAPLLGS